VTVPPDESPLSEKSDFAAAHLRKNGIAAEWIQVKGARYVDDPAAYSPYYFFIVTQIGDAHASSPSDCTTRA
jgi:hypothetical protein